MQYKCNETVQASVADITKFINLHTFVHFLVASCPACSNVPLSQQTESFSNCKQCHKKHDYYWAWQ